MFELEHHLIINTDTIRSPNLCHHFTEQDLKLIGERVYEGYKTDLESRKTWERRTESAMDLALQIQKEKTTPWPGSANVNFPLVTIAVLQFHARAYPAIIQGTSVVQYRVTGPDPTGEQTKRADRIANHMSYQVLEEDSDWEEQHDRMLINTSVVGTSFKKSYYDSSRGHNISELVLAKDLVLNYWAKSVEGCSRKTHVYPMSRNDIHERVLSGTFLDILDEAWYRTPSADTSARTHNQDKRHGLRPDYQDEESPRLLLEQHCSLDLDGDGYAEPYIITIDDTSHQPLRIVTRFDREEDIRRVESGKRKGQIIKINPMEYFTKYGFIPSPDGGIYDIGFGTLMGPLNETVNTIINQLIDAGTLSNTSGGFLGRGAKIRGGDYTFKPFEWKRVDSTGEDLSKSLIPLPVREPSAVLLNLLSLIVNYTNRISGATDSMVGENPGQNTPAETSRSMIEQGTKIYNTIFKRIWRSMKQEFQKLYTLNAIYLPIEQPFGQSDRVALREDYLGDPTAIAPVADPHIASDEQKLRQALALKQAATTTGGYNRDEVERFYLDALHIDDIDRLYPGMQKIPPPPNPKVQIEQLKQKSRTDHVHATQMVNMAKLEEEKRVNDAKIMELHARAVKEMTDAGGAAHASQLAEIETALNVHRTNDERIHNQIEQARGIANDQRDRQSNSPPANAPGSGVPGMAEPSSDQSTPAPSGEMGGGAAGPAGS